MTTGNANEEVLEELMAWLREQIAARSFGDVGIKLAIHAGKIAKVQKFLTEKMQ